MENFLQGTLLKNFRTTHGAELFTVEKFHEQIVDGTYRGRVENIREVEKPEAAVLKGKLPLFVVQGNVMKRRMLEGFCAPTPYAYIDIDHITPEQVKSIKAIMTQQPWVKEVHVSCSGQGLHAIVMMGVIPVAPSTVNEGGFTPYVSKDQEKAYTKEYKRRYLQIMSKVEELTGVKTDKQCKDVLRGLYPSYDPDAFIRADEEMEVFPYTEEGVVVEAPKVEEKVVDTQKESVPATTPAITTLQPQLVKNFLTYHQYHPSERHSWWINFAQYLKAKGIAKECVNLYMNAMQMHLAMHELIKPDDPLLRSTQEVQNAMDWGYTHSEVSAKVKTTETSSTNITFDTKAISSSDIWSGKVNDDEELARLKAIHLPKAFAASIAPQPERVKFPTMAGIMPMAQTYATDVEVKYSDGKKQRLNGMSCIIAEQGGLKSGVKDMVYIWKQPLEESDQRAREKEDGYKEKRRNKKANEKLEPAPQDPIIVVPPTISCSSLLKRFKNSLGRHLFSYCEEIDTVRKTNGAGSWSAKYDIYRLAFDNGQWGQDYNSDQSESGMVDVAYNWSFMGTPNAVALCFAKNGSVENGLTGRVWHAVIPPQRYAHMPKYREVPEKDVTAIHNGAKILSAAKGYIDTPRLRKAAQIWCDGKADEAEATKDDVIDVFRKRAAIIGFRAGVTFHILEQGEAWLREGKDLNEDFMQDATESQDCVDFAILVSDYVLKYQCLLYGSQLITERQNVKDSAGTYHSRNKNLLEELGDEFTFEQICNLRPTTKYSALRVMISKWKKEGQIEMVEKNHWKKISSNS